MNPQSLGSAVYLSNVDDYNGLSQACVNPIFTSTSSDTRPSLDQPQASSERSKVTNEVPLHNQHRSGVRSRRGRPRVDISSPLINTTNSAANPSHSLEPSLTTNTEINASKNSSNTSDVVTATIADCLACSGCITTAETVLLQEQHSLAKLKEHLFPSFPTSRPAGVGAALRLPLSDEHYTFKQIPTVLTMSPASIADLCRCLFLPEAHNSKIEETTTNQNSSHQREQLLLQLTAVLHEFLNISAVMDSTVTLHTTLQIAADEFCQAFQNNHSKEQQYAVTITKEEEYEHQLLPSVALSSNQTQYWIPPTVHDDDQSKSTTKVAVVDRSECTSRMQQSFPILSSSCPAIVCLVEKSYPTMVPHLSTTISPMIAAARQFWNPVVPMLFNKPITTTQDQQYVDDLRIEFFHLAVMPCHDKKLEASRNDFRMPHHDDGSNTSLYRPNVNMVITTMELIQLLYDAITMRNKNYVETKSPQNDSKMTVNAMYDIVRQTILSFPITQKSSKDHLPVAIDCTSLVTTHFQHATRDAFVKVIQQQISEYTHQNRPILFTMSTYQMPETAEISPASTPSSLNVTGSGGYADYIFRYIAKNNFGLNCPNDASIWIPIVDEENINRRQDNNQVISGNSQNAMSQPLPMRMSVRTARQRKQREYYEAIIFRDNESHQHFVAKSTSTSAATRNDSTIVLRFVIAYGMSLVQSVLSKLTRSYDGDTAQQQQPDHQVHYMECMACTHSCLNGNGQIRSSSNNAAVVIRETPLDIKLRVQRTHQYYPMQQYHVTATTDDTKSSNDVDMINTNENLYRNDPVFYTRYHIVPPMQHTMGVAAGIAVQDTQW